MEEHGMRVEEGGRECFYSLIPFSNIQNDWDGARLKLGGRNSVT